MKTYRKNHIYKGYNFFIEVILDSTIGKNQHLININETHGRFIGKEYSSADNLANAISQTIKSAENWVESIEGRSRNQSDILLETIGFIR